MRTIILLTTVHMFFSCLPAAGQSNFSLLFDGAVLGGNPHVIDDNFDFKSFEAKNLVFPGVEIRFNQDGRLTFGASYQRWELDRAPEHFTVISHPETGREMAGYDLTSAAGVDVLFGTVYVNLRTIGRVRPFVAGGVGLNRCKVKNSTSTFVDRNFESVFGYQFEFDLPPSFSEKFNKLAIKGTAGLNLFPGEGFVISLSGGYLNGGIFNFGAGVTF
ncbi:hypothetical protein MYX75_02340 [Acidobacteria bacterium AH-259-A15]|nr:hypothetical protein [Acidobacteria bacterium AH-259-A15]